VPQFVQKEAPGMTVEPQFGQRGPVAVSVGASASEVFACDSPCAEIGANVSICLVSRTGSGEDTGAGGSAVAASARASSTCFELSTACNSQDESPLLEESNVE
jgi:hypothetical protein